ncbi:MAG: DUF159 family protein [Actinobacteria bacterium HGW-Actinobacteria-4]|nr:MAG: DUF159 family protein [Actinobacteria bacterium HGW-Actinobacteria-4]
MCGRYADFLTEQQLTDHFAIATVADDARLLPPSWNVAPTQSVRLVEASSKDSHGRTLRTARWGLVPSWAKDPSVGARLINARSETVADKPSFKSAFAKRRCLIPASGYYEWRVEGGIKIPHFIADAGGAPLAFAGLYEWWRDPSGGENAPWMMSCAILTTAARERMRELHDRQPVMVDGPQFDTWLSADASPSELFDAIEAPTPELTWHAVSRDVGNVRNNHAALVEPA